MTNWRWALPASPTRRSRPRLNGCAVGTQPGRRTRSCSQMSTSGFETQASPCASSAATCVALSSAGSSMTWPGFSFLIVGVLLNAAAQLLLKAGTNSLGVITLTRDNWVGEFGRMAVEPHFIAGAACYGGSLGVWLLGLSGVPVPIAYPLLSVGYVINAIAAYYLLGEALTAARWTGIGFIIIGVWLVARSLRMRCQMSCQMRYQTSLE